MSNKTEPKHLRSIDLDCNRGLAIDSSSVPNEYVDLSYTFR